MTNLVERIIDSRDRAKRHKDRELLDVMADAANALTERDRNILKLVAGLKTMLTYHERVQTQLGEAVHAGFRKGSIGGGTDEVWKAMSKCTTFNDAMSYAVDGLEYGLREEIMSVREFLKEFE